MNNFSATINRKGTASLKWEKYRNTDIIPLWVADMDFPVSNEIQQALIERISHPIHGYTVATTETSDIVCNMLKKDFDWEIQADWLVWLPGVVPGLWASCKAFGEPGDNIVFNTPIYHHFFYTPPAAGKVSLPVPLMQTESGRFTYDFKALEESITDNTAVMLLCSPHNPTGTLFTQEETQQMAQFCEQHNLVIVSDEIHCGLVLSKDKQHIPTAKAHPEIADRLVTLMSPSKTFNVAGLNCSFAIISNPELREKFQQACSEAIPPVASLSYPVLEAAYGKSHQWHQDLLTTLRENHDYLVDSISKIDGLSMAPMEATYLAWINTEQLGVEDAAALFESFGVGLSDGKSFGLDGYVRLNFACPMDTLVEAIKRMTAAVKSL